MITVKWMMLCEYASVNIDNKINLLGVFDELNCKEIPLHMSRMYVVLDTIMEDNFAGLLYVFIAKYDRKLTVAESDPLPIAASGRSRQSRAFPIEFKDLTFPELGQYKVQVYFSDKVIHSGYLNLVQSL